MKITDTHVYFWSGIYSNWHNCEFTCPEANLTFGNTEQAFMWFKADCFADLPVRAKIEKVRDPKEVKKLGRLISNYNDDLWSTKRYAVMVYVNTLKFQQNSEFASELLETGDRILVEASPLDKIWGVGLDENNPLILNETNWVGQNLLGKALMEVRAIIRNPPKYDDR